jgi:hypothetical protein
MASPSITSGQFPAPAPQQRLTLLLVCAERSTISDAAPAAIGALEQGVLVELLAARTDRLSAREPHPASASVEPLYPELAS